MRYLSLVLLSFCIFSSSYSQIDCPPDTEVECYQVAKFYKNVVIETNKLELIPERLSGENGCGDYTFTMGYFLYDVEEDVKETSPTCVQDITVRSFDPNHITWPDSVVYVSDIDDLPESKLREGLLPELENICNLVYTFEDLILGPSISQKIVRKWTALDWCTAQTYSFHQVIKEELAQVNGMFVNVQNCGGTEVLLEDVEFKLNDVVIDNGACNFNTVIHVLNCLAETHELNSNDRLSLTFITDNTALSGISTVDLVKIQRHILSLEKFTDPCSLWAADVNNDNRINGIDLIELRKLILGIHQELPSGHPELFLVDGKLGGELIFTGYDFPLDRLELVHTTKGDVGN